MKAPYFLLMIFFLAARASAQNASAAAVRWADSVYNTLSDNERIGQLMVVRLSTIDPKTKTITFFDTQVAALVKEYNIGGICLFQGGPVKQATLVNSLQAAAKTPILICMDAEWGVGMRLTDSVLPLPRQMMLGAMKNAGIVYHYGQIVAAQCRRMGIQVNYAPVVDVNNNPGNPVINDRSFGQDKYKVANFGIAYMKGMQDAGVLACAKHFPGHGDVTTDSHYDLPVITKTVAQLDSLELYPFRKIFEAGIGSVMVAHLFIPAIDSTPNRATSLSPKNINGLMRAGLGYNGLTFTDALEMQGVKKFYPDGAASVQSLVAGNDMLCLPGDVALSVEKIKDAIAAKKLSWRDIEMHCKKVLATKFTYGLAKLTPVNTINLTADLNKNIIAMRRTVAENAITLVAKSGADFFPLRDTAAGDIAFAGFGISEENSFAKRIKNDFHAAAFYFGSNDKYDDSLVATLAHFKKVVIGIHGFSRFPANNFGLAKDMVSMIRAVQQRTNNISFLFGNAYAMKNFCDAPNAAIAYEDDSVVQNTAADMLLGRLPYKGVLPVTVCDGLRFGFGIEIPAAALFQPAAAGTFNAARATEIDSIAADAIAKRATPGCVVLALKNGKIAYEKAFGTLRYNAGEPAGVQTVYDLASLTKIFSTLPAVMRLYEQGKLDLNKVLGDYLPETRGTDKQDIKIENLLLHEAGLEAFTPLYKETIDAAGNPLPLFYRRQSSDSFNIPVARNLFLRTAFRDTLYRRILQSRRGPAGKYLYSDNDFLFLQKVVEQVTGEAINVYVRENFYEPMQLHCIGFHPLETTDSGIIAPTENEKVFRQQLLRGFVHDPGAAMSGGVAGHAGLFSDADDLAAFMQMFLDGGVYNGRRYFAKETVDLFTACHSNAGRRGYGFDKPEKDNAARTEPYPAAAASAATFGHLGFTGTCAWADPASGLVFIFLSNRLYPDGQNLLANMNIRGKILAAVYAGLASASVPLQ